MLYLIAGILFAIFAALWKIIRWLDTIVALIGGRGQIIEDKNTLPPKNVRSRHDELIHQWKYGG